jgi:hypothetical protein
MDVAAQQRDELFGGPPHISELKRAGIRGAA